LVRDGNGLTRITCRGRLSEAAVLEFETELRVQLNGAKAQSLDVVIDLSAVTDFCHDCRDVLVRVHQFALTRARNVVIVANQPATRGLALWMMHMAGDRGASIAPSIDDALSLVLAPRTSSLPPPIESHIRALYPATALDTGAAPTDLERKAAR
jgi:anti-anti-sigma regulatory factor